MKVAVQIVIACRSGRVGATTLPSCQDRIDQAFRAINGAHLLKIICMQGRCFRPCRLLKLLIDGLGSWQRQHQPAALPLTLIISLLGSKFKFRRWRRLVPLIFFVPDGILLVQHVQQISAARRHHHHWMRMVEPDPPLGPGCLRICLLLTRLLIVGAVLHFAVFEDLLVAHVDLVMALYSPTYLVLPVRGSAPRSRGQLPTHMLIFECYVWLSNYNFARHLKIRTDSMRLQIVTRF